MLISSWKPIWTVTDTLVQSALGGIVGTSSVQILQTMGSTLGYAILSEESLKNISKITREKIDEANLSLFKHKLTALEKTFQEYLVAPNSSKDRLNYATSCSQEILQYLKSLGKSQHEVFHFAASLRLNILLERIKFYQDRDEINNFANAVNEYVEHSEAIEKQWLDWHNSRFSELYSRPMIFMSSGQLISATDRVYFDIDGVKNYLWSGDTIWGSNPYSVKDYDAKPKGKRRREQIIGDELIKLKKEILEPANKVRQSWLQCKKLIIAK